MDKIQIIILAAGHGKRMNNGEIPKVLTPLHGKPLIGHLLDSIARSGVCARPVIVVGQKADMVRSALGPSYTYVFQESQLGTGHAVASTRGEIAGTTNHVMVLYGDHPLVSPKTIRTLTDAHCAAGTVLSMATVRVDDFNDWRAGFSDFGRIIRNSQGEITSIVEKRDATPDQLAIKEVNPGYYCFKSKWLWDNLDRLRNENSQHEYYLTDMVGIARAQQYRIASVEISPQEALGVNTPEQLALVARLADLSDTHR